MTVQTSEPTNVAAPSCHGHGSAADEPIEARTHGADGRSHAGTGAKAFGTVLALPRPVKIIGGAVVGLGALLAVGVPLATLTPLVFLGGCLSMHLFMGHGMSHGEGHGSHETNAAASAKQPETASPRNNG